MQSHGKPVEGGYESLDQKPYESHYRLFETVLDYPVEKIWPHALNIRAWMSDHGLETVAGEPGKVGHFERVWPRGVGPEVPPPHYHVYGIAEIIPLKCIALEVLLEKGGSYGNTREKFGFDSFLFADLGGRTKVIFFMLDVYPQAQQRAAESPLRLQTDEQDLRDRLERYFDNLKRLVAGSAG